MTTFTLKQLAEEHKPWCFHNFGERQPVEPLLGIIEELGELYDASCEGIAKWDDVVDAVGDTLVYMADFSGKMQFDLTFIHERAQFMRTDSPARYQRVTFASVMGRLAHAQLKMMQKIRGTPDEHRRRIADTLVDAMAILEREMRNHPCNQSENAMTIIDAVDKTWAKVKLRDWKKDAMHGGETPT